MLYLRLPFCKIITNAHTYLTAVEVTVDGTMYDALIWNENFKMKL